MPYIPGDNWCICDLTGKKVLMSQTKKTWDGLRVWEQVWYPKHPQLSLRAIPDRMAVIDGRPRPVDQTAVVPYGWGTFCLTSPNGTNFVAAMQDDGAMVMTPGLWGSPLEVFYIGQYGLTVDNDGALFVHDAGAKRNIDPWRLYSVNKLGFDITIDSDMAVLVSLVTGPTFMTGVVPRDGVFTLVSPNGTSYVLYIVDDMAVMVVPGSWGPQSSAFFLGEYILTVDNDGAILARASGEKWPPTYRMVSVGGYEYLWWADDDGAIKIGRQGHWWDVPCLVYDKVQSPYAENVVIDTITEDAKDAWVAE